MKVNSDTNYIIDNREYYIKNINYNLRIEIDQKYIYFILTNNNDSLIYNYKNKIELNIIINKLELNSYKYNNLELILKVFDILYDKNKIQIKINNDDNTCNILIKYNNLFTEVEHEIKLYKEYMNINDKINIIYNELKLIKNNNNKSVQNNSNIRSEDNNIISKNMNNDVIELINKKMIEIENKLMTNYNIFENKMSNIINNINNYINTKINDINKKLNDNIKDDNKIEFIDKKCNNIFNDIGLIRNLDKNNKDKIEEINKKLIEQERYIKNINNEINEIKYKINNKLSTNDKDIDKINNKFKKEPKDLKYKYDITNTNTVSGLNDIFEIFKSYKDNKEYLISPNNNNYCLDIFSLLDNRKISSINGHKKKIRTVRYFINNKDNHNEYLISGDDNKIVIIWDITNNYNIKYEIDTKYKDDIYSCLLIFPHNINDNYIITSTTNKSYNMDESSTKIYSLNNGKFIKYINNTTDNAINYLLSWYNKNIDKYYIIQFSFKKIIINDLIEDDNYLELIREPESDHVCGLIYSKDNKDYLYSSLDNGYIHIWDLYDKILFKIISINRCKLAHIIEWSNKYFIVVDNNSKSFKIFDVEKNKVISDIYGQNTDEIICIKKINHPIYGESLLSAGYDKTIKLWTL